MTTTIDTHNATYMSARNRDYATEIHGAVQTFLTTHHDLMIQTGFYHPSFTANKITGMFIETHGVHQTYAIIHNSDAFDDWMVDACEILYIAGNPAAAVAQ